MNYTDRSHPRAVPRCAKVALVLVLATLYGSAGAQSSMPTTTTTAPTTAPTTVPVSIDASTPKAAVLTFARALDVGDMRALEAIVYRGDDTERRMADAMIRMAGALASFRQAAIAQFGKEEADKAMDDPDAKFATAMARIDSAVEKVEGDTATVGQPDEPPVVLRRVNGNWQVVIGALTASDNAKMVEDRIRGIDRQATVVSELAADIRADRHRTMREVVTILHGQMMKAALEEPEGKTQNGER